jgi:hypothetical protein
LPSGKKYSKNERKWVDIETERKIDYDAIANQAAAILLEYWRLYPDRLLALCEADTPDYRMTPIQCLMIRAECREQRIFITGGRGSTKSYVGLASRLLMGKLYPGITLPYYGPSLKQTIKIARDAFTALQKNYPLLCDGWFERNITTDRFLIETKYHSVIEVGVMRGGNASAVFAEEVAQEEAGEQFDHEKFRAVVLPAVRVQRMVNNEPDEWFPNTQKCYVTSAGRKQNESFNYRNETHKMMMKGDRAFCVDIPASVAVLNSIRTLDWYNEMKRELTPEEWLREMESIWTGTCENPVIRDSTLAESKNLLFMEDRHCGDPNVTYIIGYDVSYAEGAKNAKCATTVLKLEEQDDPYKKGHLLKSVVYVLNEPPPAEGLQVQARRLKDRWYRFCLEGGNPTYLVVDARQYGQGVVEELHKDLGDGLPPLCCIDHELYNMERDGALPVIYPLSATGRTGDKDSDGDMIRYCELEWEQRNVRLLTSNINEGVMAYKRVHKIKDDHLDAIIAIPYRNTRDLAGQIANLKKEVAGAGVREKRLSKAIQRDMWSSTKYAMWYAKQIEYKILMNSNMRQNDWQKFIKDGIRPHENQLTRIAQSVAMGGGATAPRISAGIGRTGGNRRWG